MPSNKNNIENSKNEKHHATWRYKRDGNIKVRIVFSYEDRFLIVRLQSMVGILFHKTIYKRQKSRNIMYLYINGNKITEPDSDNSDDEYEFYESYKIPNDDKKDNKYDSNSESDDSDTDNDYQYLDSIKKDYQHKKRHFKKSIFFKITWKGFLKQNNIKLEMVRKPGIEYDFDDINYVDWSLNEDMDTDQSSEEDIFGDYFNNEEE
jgi:hypothetical protein